MIRAYRDRKTVERDRQIADLKFLASAFGAEVKDDTPSPTPMPRKKSPADVIRAMGGKVSTVKRPQGTAH